MAIRLEHPLEIVSSISIRQYIASLAVIYIKCSVTVYAYYTKQNHVFNIKYTRRDYVLVNRWLHTTFRVAYHIEIIPPLTKNEVLHFIEIV